MTHETIRDLVAAYAGEAGWPQSDACIGVFGDCWQKRGIKKKAGQNYPKAYASHSAGAIVYLDSITRLYWDPVMDRVWFHFEREVPHDPLIERLMQTNPHWSREAILNEWRNAEAQFRGARMFHSGLGKSERLGPKEQR